MQAVKRIYRYLSGIRFYGLIYILSGNRRLVFTGWMDADWVVNSDSRKSVVVYVFILCGVVVLWLSKMLLIICLLSTESEYGVLIRAGKEVVFCRVILKDVNQK